jgi:hypothetical protein
MRYSSEEDDAEIPEKKTMVAKTSWITTSSRCAPTQNNKMALYTDSNAGIGIGTSRSVENLGAQSDNKLSTSRPFARARSAPCTSFLLGEARPLISATQTGDIESKDSDSEDPNAYTGAPSSSRQLTARQEYTWALALALSTPSASLHSFLCVRPTLERQIYVCLKQQKATQTHSAQGRKRAETQEHDKAEKVRSHFSFLFPISRLLPLLFVFPSALFTCSA